MKNQNKTYKNKNQYKNKKNNDYIIASFKTASGRVKTIKVEIIEYGGYNPIYIDGKITDYILSPDYEIYEITQYKIIGGKESYFKIEKIANSLRSLFIYVTYGHFEKYFYMEQSSIFYFQKIGQNYYLVIIKLLFKQKGG